VNQHNKNRQFPAGNPLANILVVAFFALMGVVLCFAAILGVRAWWIARRMRGRRPQRTTQQGHGAHDSQTIEGEYRVIAADKKNPPKN
jgi:predicted lipid-binding transport protein (Tim44 family)